MPAPRSKSLFAWEPSPFIVVGVLLLATSIVRPEAPPWVLWPFVALLAVAVAWLAGSLLRGGRSANPDQWGDLTTLEGLELVDALHVDRGVRAVAPVSDVQRHQPAIELALLHGGTQQLAVLVPRASRWLSRRYRIGVQLVGGDHPRHAGFLEEAADVRWRDALDAMRQRGQYVRVPALIVGNARPFKVELDLSGLEHALEARPDR
ncbi:hypothetical protein [Agromyces humatus]|uniref:Uncharacterized protein n=1 Tax=Agromyces humatus TaxID=279573 RepID=A0ABN2K494_9MICO|nr:hypothetical protein [Agromyces humatus]